MAGRLASTSASPPSVSLFGSAAFASAASPPQQSFALPKPMSADVLSAPGGMSSHPFGLSPIGERRPMEGSASLLSLSKLEQTASHLSDIEGLPAILMRKLPRNTTLDVLRTMLLFAKDMVEVGFVDPEYPEDAAYSSAVARFMSLAGANDAKEKLNGKTISSDAKLLVELFQSGIAFPGTRRNTVDSATLRHTSSSASSTGSSGPGIATGRQSSRFNGTFQSLEKMSPPNGSLGSEKLPAPESKNSIQSLFSPQSPLANATISSKNFINDDDDTGKLLKDPVAYARSGENVHSRRTTNPEIPTSRFAGLSMLSTAPNGLGVQSPPTNGYVSPSSRFSVQSPNSTFSPNGTTPLSSLSLATSFAMAPPYHQRHPAPNPADQNPPCNTLYVGNLPVDTSEDELKAVFSKQRGYKRLCFRTKQNGPMCFVEFEDVSFATKALHELYGHPLHNSVKGGIRLSFSKNPLGVRSGQQGSGLQTQMGPPPGMQGLNGGGIGALPGFATATGPPPGLPNPSGGGSPALSMNGGSAPPNYGLYGGAGNFGLGNGGGYGHGQTMRQPISMPTTMAGSSFQGLNNDYVSYMGR